MLRKFTEAVRSFTETMRCQWGGSGGIRRASEMDTLKPESFAWDAKLGQPYHRRAQLVRDAALGTSAPAALPFESLLRYVGPPRAEDFGLRA
jgi:hypothetical protein